MAETTGPELTPAEKDAIGYEVFKALHGGPDSAQDAWARTVEYVRAAHVAAGRCARALKLPINRSREGDPHHG